MEENYIRGKLPEDLYYNHLGKLSNEIIEIQDKLSKYSKKISNQKEKIKLAVQLIQDISKIWDKAT